MDTATPNDHPPVHEEGCRQAPRNRQAGRQYHGLLILTLDPSKALLLFLALDLRDVLRAVGSGLRTADGLW